MVYLWWVAGSVITAVRVFSLPVPAVVGTAINSGSRWCTRSRPPSFTGFTPGRTSMAPAALAQSMAEPPPRATMAPQPCCRYTPAASVAFCTVGLARVSLYTASCTPPFCMALHSWLYAGVCTMPLSVTSSILSTFCSFNTCGSWFTLWYMAGSR